MRRRSRRRSGGRTRSDRTPRPITSPFHHMHATRPEPHAPTRTRPRYAAPASTHAYVRPRRRPPADCGIAQSPAATEVRGQKTHYKNMTTLPHRDTRPPPAPTTRSAGKLPTSHQQTQGANNAHIQRTCTPAHLMPLDRHRVPLRPALAELAEVPFVRLELRRRNCCDHGRQKTREPSGGYHESELAMTLLTLYPLSAQVWVAARARRGRRLPRPTSRSGPSTR